MTQPAASKVSSTVRIGEYSSHSPGCFGGGNSCDALLETSMPIDCAVTAVAAPGADQIAMITEIISSTAVITIDCQRKIVSENGITPEMGSRLFGRLAGLACSCAADEERPM